MSIPDYQTVMLPLLRLVGKHGRIKLKDARSAIADEFHLSNAEKSALLPSGKQTVIYNRVGWAGTYLRKAGLLKLPQRGVLEITERGRQVLSDHPVAINVKYLQQFPEFIEFRSVNEVKHAEDSVSEVVNVSQGTPEEILEEAHAQLKSQVLSDLVERLKLCSPQFFEEVVIDTVVKMGYGGSRKDAGKAIGRSGDEGVDGIINEDRLGLDVIYLQAKRWEGNVSRPEIQKFAGALQGKRAKKGIFITTSDFTGEAREFVRNIEAKIILISGIQFADLMYEHNIGLNTAAIYELKKLDLDYCNE
ncbi:MAG: restriction endonuclease [Deltaproteobacteria bacterium]|nr:restriction endonuclease [Deltaproteobacteria bacterium]